MILERNLAFRLPLLRGDDVRRAQLALIRAGALRGEADGAFGPATRDAVLEFQRRARLPADGIIGPVTWSRLGGEPGLQPDRPWQDGLRPFLPAITAWHGDAGRLSWRLTRAGIEIQGENAPRRNGDGAVAARCWATYRQALGDAARRFSVPVELLLAIACTESAGRATALREEPGYVDDEATPHRVSPGLMQTLISTAREALGDPKLDRARLLDPAVSAAAGAAYVARQGRTGKAPTGFDPPLAAIAYNAGSLRADRNAANPWGLVQTRRGNVWHADILCAHLGDTYARFAAGEAPDETVPSFWPLLG
ncbi:peptidoglycan-binding protein [Roseococcus sp. YIM B11640]|uniref:peptidoglycan-binding protein n=1 Tax=Roseococcus sp. YIM B11640 TaxID=3133973 RepID=UPI003C7AC976